jgi:hypothetical protein
LGHSADSCTNTKERKNLKHQSNAYRIVLVRFVETGIQKATGAGEILDDGCA